LSSVDTRARNATRTRTLVGPARAVRFWKIDDGCLSSLLLVVGCVVNALVSLVRVMVVVPVFGCGLEGRAA
jgi:hypothetical protein